MKLSTKGRYAITAMMELALRNKQGPVTLADISVEQSISVSYLEQLFAMLRKSGLVTGLRGPGGGYCLRRPASEISIAEILRAVDDSLKPAAKAEATAQADAEATSEEAPKVEEVPKSIQMWDQLSQHIYDYLDSISLADAVTEQEASPDGENKPSFGGFQRTAA